METSSDSSSEEGFTNHSLISYLLENISRLCEHWKIISFKYKKPISPKTLRRVYRCTDFTDNRPGSVVLLGNETMKVGRSRNKDIMFIEFLWYDREESSRRVSVYNRYYMVFTIDKEGRYYPAYCCKAPITDDISDFSHIDITEDRLAIKRLLDKSIEISASKDYTSRVIAN